MYERAIPLARPNPWLSIWTEPRATVRFLADRNPTGNVVLLAALGGVAQALSRAVDQSTGEHLSLTVILLLAGVLGSLTGVIMLYIGSYLLRWTGRWIGGRASLEHIRTAMGWANVPLVVSLVLLLLIVAAVGPVLFMSEETLASHAMSLRAGLLLLVYGMATIVLALWSFLILLKGLAEVQGFSAWRALANLILSTLPAFAVGAVILYVLSPSATSRPC